jgi:hypothetical protein
MSTDPRDVASLDYIQLWDEGCVRTRLNELTQIFMAKAIKEDMEKIADEAKRAFKPVPTYNAEGINLSEKFGAQAREEAEKILEVERQIFVDSRSEKLKPMLSEIKNKLNSLMFENDNKSSLVKPTFVSRRVDTGSITYSENYMSFFGEKNRDRLQAVSDIQQRLREFGYMLSYVSPEIKGLWEEIQRIMTPNHYELWYGDHCIQVYGGERYAEEDKKFDTPEKWVKAVSKRAKGEPLETVKYTTVEIQPAKKKSSKAPE